MPGLVADEIDLSPFCSGSTPIRQSASGHPGFRQRPRRGGRSAVRRPLGPYRKAVVCDGQQRPASPAQPGGCSEIRGIIVNLLDELAEIDKDRPLDAFDRFFVKAEAVRHIIRDALDEHVGCREDDANPLVASMREALPRITQADQARLVGLSLRHFQRLGKEGGMPPRQLVLAAKLVKLLRYVWNPEGTLAWFYRERKQLDGHAPIELMADPGFEQSALGLAREGRALHAA